LKHGSNCKVPISMPFVKSHETVPILDSLQKRTLERY
jgi:hypothetical protein